MKILVVSSSLSPNSRSRLMAKAVASRYASTEDVEVDFLDLRETVLPLCDGGASYGHPAVKEVSARLAAADACVMASPIYNYDVNAALKNLVEFAGRQLEGKLVGFLGAAGGAMSYMSMMPLANSLMLDFRVIVMPRFVYATGKDWDGDALLDKIRGRLTQFEDDFLALARKLSA